MTTMFAVHAPCNHSTGGKGPAALSDVAHELRTPLSNIRGYLEAVQDGVVEPERHIIDSLHGEAMLLNRLVDDLQELSLAEAGQLRLERQPVALADVVGRAVEAVRPRADAEEITLQVDLPEDLLVDVDPHRIGQVLRNLLENALTHTPPGGEIAVATRAACPEPGGALSLALSPVEGLSKGRRGDQWVEVSVRDTGSGIAAGGLPYVFERFYRSDKSRSRATGGAGLGLAIARQLADAPDARPLEQVTGDVVFEDVCFGYEPGVPVLKQVDFHAEPGRTIALVGPTGAGKTTIVNLLTRFYDIDSGQIAIDGTDIRQVKKADLRCQLGIVLQDTFLFSDTVMENIRYGRLDATDEEVIAAARLANADQFIRRLPQGYQKLSLQSVLYSRRIVRSGGLF